MRGLAGKHTILTGGASGIGRATTIRLVAEGCVVGIFDLNGHGAEETVALAQASAKGGGRAVAYRVDITDEGQVGRATDEFEREAGPVELLANIAGWDSPTKFLETDRTFWDKVIAVNLYGPLTMHRVVVKRMTDRRFGRVVNVASDAGRVGSTGEAVYSACKGGIIAFTKAIAREVMSRGVIVNAICPGPVDTPLFGVMRRESPKLAAALEAAIPMGRLGRPDDFPGTIAFFLSDDAAYITGQTISVSGGLTMHG